MMLVGNDYTKLEQLGRYNDAKGKLAEIYFSLALDPLNRHPQFIKTSKSIKSPIEIEEFTLRTLDTETIRNIKIATNIAANQYKDVLNTTYSTKVSKVIHTSTPNSVLYHAGEPLDSDLIVVGKDQSMRSINIKYGNRTTTKNFGIRSLNTITSSTEYDCVFVNNKIDEHNETISSILSEYCIGIDTTNKKHKHIKQLQNGSSEEKLLVTEAKRITRKLQETLTQHYYSKFSSMSKEKLCYAISVLIGAQDTKIPLDRIIINPDTNGVYIFCPKVQFDKITEITNNFTVKYSGTVLYFYAHTDKEELKLCSMSMSKKSSPFKSQTGSVTTNIKNIKKLLNGITT